MTVLLPTAILGVLVAIAGLYAASRERARSPKRDLGLVMPFRPDTETRSDNVIAR